MRGATRRARLDDLRMDAKDQREGRRESGVVMISEKPCIDATPNILLFIPL